jgi:hypothetical protein
LTLTPLPTFENPVAEIRILIRDNAGCHLPCWWGITPGTTSWLQASQFFVHFGDHITLESLREGQLASRPYQRFIAYYTSGLPIDYAVSTMIDVTDGLIRSLGIDAESSMASGFSPRKILTDIGEPDEILVHDGNLVTLWYESRGVAATYLLDETPSSDELCISAFWGTLAWDPSDSAFAGQARSQLHYVASISLEEAFSVSTTAFLAMIASQGIGGCDPP